MANTATTRPVPFGAVAILNVVTFFSNTFGNALASYNADRNRKDLSALSNRLLDDIGLMPGDIQTTTRRVTLLH